MTITFWGVRGSIPVPGEGTERYGGNTSCVAVEIGARVLAIDAGTGIRSLGDALSEDGREAFILLTHLHADHVQGFPLFSPLYRPEHTVHLIEFDQDAAPGVPERHWSLLRSLDGIHFPRRPDAVECDLRRNGGDAMAYLREHGFRTSRLSVNHPGGAYGYRVESAGRAFVHIPDNEIDDADPTVDFDELVRFCRGADVLCHDAQYLGEEIDLRIGWGHSNVERVCDLAEAAGVGRLILFHHDPDRTDDQLDAIEAMAKTRLGPLGIECVAAREGMSVEL